MSYVNDTKPSGSFTNSTKPTTPSNIQTQGSPIAAGLFMFLTYASSQGYVAGTKPTGSFTNDSKPA